MIEKEVNVNPSFPYYIIAIAISIGALLEGLSRFFSYTIPMDSNIVIYIFIALSVALFFFSFNNIEKSLIAFIFIFPVVRYELPGLPFYFTFGDAYILILGFAWFTRIVLRGTYRPFQTFLDRPIFLFFIFTTMAAVKSVSLMTGFISLAQEFEYFIVTLYIFAVVVSNRNVLENVSMSLALSSMLFSLLGLIEYLQNGGGSYRIHAYFGHFNAFGCYLSMMIPFVFNQLFIPRAAKTRNVYFVVLTVNMAALMLTFSRGAWIATLAGIVLSGQLRGLGSVIKVLSLILFLSLVGSLIIPQRFIGRAATITQIDDDSSRARITQYKMAWDIIQKYPHIGVGLGNLPYAAKEDYNCAACGEVHNLFLYLASERGILSVGTFIWILILLLWRIAASFRESESSYYKGVYVSVAAAITSYIVANMTAFMFVRGVGILFTLLIGLYIATTKVEANAIQQESEEWHLPTNVRRSPNVYVGA